MQTHFLLFLVVFIAALLATYKSYQKMAFIINETYAKDEAILASIGVTQDIFHLHLIVLMAHMAHIQRADIGVLQFIYQYITTILPKDKKLQKELLEALEHQTCLQKGKRYYKIVDAKATRKKGQLVVDEDNLKLVDLPDVKFIFEWDANDIIEPFATKEFRKVGRNYIMYLLCKTICACTHSTPNFSELKELCKNGLNIPATDIDALIDSAKENRLEEWYKTYVTNDAYKTDMLHTEFPALPPYNYREEPVRRANWWSMLFYTVLFVTSFYTIKTFNSYNLSLILFFPLFCCFLIGCLSLIYTFYMNIFIAEDNKMGYKPTRIHKLMAAMVFGLCGIFLIIGFRDYLGI